MMCLLWPILINPVIAPIAIAVSAGAIGAVIALCIAVGLAPMNPIFALFVALF
jgi:hypothetical protein